MFEHSGLYMHDIKRLATLPLPWRRLDGHSLLISGGTGLLGVLLIDALMYRNENMNAGISITAIGRSEARAKERLGRYMGGMLDFVQADINDGSSLKAVQRHDYIIHAASNTHPRDYASDPVGTIATNVTGTQNMLQYAAENSARRLLFLSSVEIYGENDRDLHRFAESDMGYIDCNTVRAGYPESKRLGEALCCAYAAEYGLDVVIPRLCRLYGPTLLPTDSKASSQFIQNALDGRDILLKSKGEQLYSYCYAADAVAALLWLLLLGEKGETYNIADEGSDVTLRKLAETIAGIAGTKVIFDLPDAVEQAGFSKATKALLDATKLRMLGWSAVEDIHSGIEKTITIRSGK